MKKLIIGALIAATSLCSDLKSAYAADTGNIVYVSQIAVYNNGEFDAWFSGAICNDAGVTQTEGQAKLSYGTSSDGMRAMLQELIAAKISGTKMQVGTNGAATGCKIANVVAR